MTTEEKLKSLIIEKYGSMVEFSKTIDMPNPTLASIISRGINKASISNIIKICHELDISTDELANGRIVPRDQNQHDQQRKDIVACLKMEILSNDNLTLDGEPMSNEDKQILIDALEMSIEMIKRKNRREEMI